MTTAPILLAIASKLTTALPAEGPLRVPPPAVRCLTKTERRLGAEVKPHGRLAWNLYLDHGAKVDLSVMPMFPGLNPENPCNHV
jgi:hypothetical protein